MRYNKEIHRRRSVRLKGYDYAQPGVYFVTICSWQRECVFGDIVDGEMVLNEYGGIVESCLNAISEHFQFVDIDETVIMPNHVHMILTINSRGTACRALTKERFAKPVSNSIPTVIRSFKSAVTKHINTNRDTQGRPIWHRNYYERVIRNAIELKEIRKYIRNNPLKWELDKDNPANIR